MNIRILIREYLSRNYKVLWTNARFRSWLSNWFDNERNPMDLYEFYFMLVELPGSDVLVNETVKVNCYNPGKTFTENLKEVEDLIPYLIENRLIKWGEEDGYDVYMPYDALEEGYYNIGETEIDGKKITESDWKDGWKRVADWFNSIKIRIKK